MADPGEFALNHAEWRPGQEVALHFCLSIIKEGKGKVGVLEAPTGSGKTALARAVSSRTPVIALNKTKALQNENYGALYGADVMFGKGSYPCVHPEALPNATCDDCLFERNMHACPVAHQCHYLLAKKAARESNFASLNYSYWLSARWTRDTTAYNFLDEGHNLSDVVLDWAGCTVERGTAERWELPGLPPIHTRTPRKVRESLAMRWLEQSIRVLHSMCDALEEDAKSDPDDARALNRSRRLLRKFQTTAAALQMFPQDWYIEGTATKLTCRPLTARHHFTEWFLAEGRQTLIMSATIGDPKTFASELGITNYVTHTVPHQFAKELRPVRVLDAPRMGFKSSAADYQQQARAIAKAILRVPHDWSGIIHTNSKSQAKRLAQLLSGNGNGLAERVWLPPELPTEQMTAAWNKHRHKHTGALLISWAHGEGYNGLDERICIVAKVPFPSLGDPYESERLHYDGRFFLQRAAWGLEQALGRTRRGRPEDYGERNGLVAIADGNYTRVKGYLSAALREAMVQ